MYINDGYLVKRSEVMNTHGGYYGKNKKKVIDFSVNLNPLGVPNSVKEHIIHHLDNLNTYPEIDASTARTHLALSHGVDFNQVMMGNGAVELIYLLARTIKPRKVLILQPTFNEYERSFNQCGSKCFGFHLKAEDDFKMNLDELLKQLKKIKPEVVIICNPNNPTGTYFGLELIEPIVMEMKAYGGILMIDESFSSFEGLPTAISLLHHGNLLLLRSMTKYYAIAGIRLGYGIGSEKMIRHMKDHKEPWTINTIASEIVDVLITDADYDAKTQKWYKEEKRYFKKQIDRIPFLYTYDSKANFFLCKSSFSSEVLKHQLLDRGIYIRTCHDFAYLEDAFIRLALRSREDNKKLFQALMEIDNQQSDQVINE